jgi:hypothetical protein
VSIDQLLREYDSARTVKPGLCYWDPASGDFSGRHVIRDLDTDSLFAGGGFMRVCKPRLYTEDMVMQNQVIAAPLSNCPEPMQQIHESLIYDHEGQQCRNEHTTVVVMIPEQDLPVTPQLEDGPRLTWVAHEAKMRLNTEQCYLDQRDYLDAWRKK